MSKNEKRNKFTNPQKSNSKTFILVGILVLAIVAVGAYVAAGKSGSPAGEVNVGAANYPAQQAVDFASTAADTGSGDIVLNLNDIKTKKATTFSVPGINFTLANGKAFSSLPLLAYVSPKGNITVATSLCEPCSGTTFHIEGDQLVCNSCGTRWTLDGLQGVSGGCTKYPPESVKYTVQSDKLIIKKVDIQNFKPRTV